MERKNGFAKVLVSLVLTLSLFVSNICAYANVDGGVYLNDSDICSGKMIPAEMVNAAFSDEIDYDSLDEIQFKRAISFIGDNVSVNLSLFFNSSEVQLNYEGKLYKSFRHTDEKPVYIGVFEDNTTITREPGLIDDRTNDFEIIYFEISNDASPYNLNDGLREAASVTIYLRSNDGVIYDLGSEIVSPLILGAVNKQAPSGKDLYWFLNYLQGTYEEQNRSTRSTYTNKWEGDLHTLRFQVANFEHMFTATPYIDFSFGDVPYSGVMPFGMALKLSENHQYRVAGATNWTLNTGDYDKCFILDNVQLTWTAGGNTEISYVTPHLRVHNMDDDEFVGFVASVMSLLPQTASVGAILSAADGILAAGTGQSHPFTNTEQGGSLSNTGAYKIKFPADFFIDDSGVGVSNTQAERFEYVAFMATTNSDLERAYWTTAVADFSFDLSWADVTGQSGMKPYKEHKELSYRNNY